MNILVVTPDESFAESAHAELTAQGDFSVTTAASVGEAIAIVTDGPQIDCIVSDHDFPETDGIAFLQAVRTQFFAMPFILFTSEGNEEVASRAITAGVTDYLIKERHADQWDRLATLITDAIRYHRTRQEVIEIEDRAETLLDNSYDLIAIVRDGRTEYINQTGIELLGVAEKGAIIGEAADTWMETKDGPPLQDLLQAVEGEAGKIDHREATIQWGGRSVPVQLTATSIRRDDGPAAALIARDMREEEALETDLELKERAMDEAPIGVTIADGTRSDNPLIYVNEKLQEMTGYEAADFLGRNCRILQGPETDPEPVAALRTAIENDEAVTVELRNYRKGGTMFWNRVSIAPLRNDEGSVTHYVGFQQDVTPEKERERKLNRFMEAVEAAGHAIYMTNASGDIFYVNPAFERITGYDESDALGNNPRILKSGEMSEAYYEELWEQVTSGEIWREVVINRRKNGEHYHAEQTIAPITGPDGEITAYVAIQTDITERERMRQRTEIALEETDSFIFEIDIESSEVTRHGAVERFFDVDPETIRTVEAFQETVIDPADRDRFETFLDRLAAGKTEYSILDFRTTAAVGETRWLRTHAYRKGNRRIIGLTRDITDQKNREQALRQYKQAVESSKDLLAAVDENLNYLFANQEYRRYHEIGTADITNDTLEDVLGEDYAEIEPWVKKALRGRPIQTVVRRTHPVKGERILDVRLFPLEGPEGEVHGVGASMRDITEDREKEAAIERESELRRLMSEVNHELVRTTEIEPALSKVTEIIGNASEFTCTFSYVLEDTDTNVVCGGPTELSESELEAIHTESYVEAVFDAGIFHIEDVTQGEFAQHEDDVESHPGLGIALSHDDTRYGVLTVHFPPGEEPLPEDLDVLETIAADIGYFISNRLVREEYKSFTEIVERIDDPVMLQNGDGTFRLINEAVTDFAGMDKETLIGREESAFMDEATAERIDDMKTQVLETEESVSYQVEPTFPDDRERTFSTTRYPYYDEQGRLDGTIAICRDVTDLEEHQRQLRVLDRVLRHNVNNNMNVVQGYAEMIQVEGGGSIAGYAEKISENSEQLLDIAHKQRKITEFLSEPDPIETIDIGPLIDQTVDRVTTVHQGASVTVTGPNHLEVRAIPAIEEAIEEVLTNAIVHAGSTDSNPTIQIEAEADTAVIRIRDENQPISGMDRDVLTGREQLSTLRHGSGLGLWLVKLIVDHSNGQVTYESNDPRGNIVTIELKRP